ncbi:MAG: GNAT family N-acetyltransferase [Candidatus Daviesbacteria bacterium]|nr:GNAT family N-acetyltransferase [Candidatus Daviesbacteria bacterium]
MNDLISHANKKPCYFISPHLDDVVLSCSGLIMKLTDKTNITVVNIFTQAHSGPYTLSAKKYLKSSGHKNDANNLYLSRLQEDESALNSLNVKKINLDFTDALFRKKIKQSIWGKITPELEHIYPTYRWNILGNISKSDPTLQEIKDHLKKIIPKDSLIFVPLNIAGHVDHLIVREACESLFDNIVYYSEFPYSYRNKKCIEKENYRKCEVLINYNQKNKLVSCYKSQVSGLFSSGIMPKHNELYFENLVQLNQQISINIYSKLSSEIEFEWREMWKKSPYANYVNAPEWLLSLIENFDIKDYKIITVRKKGKLTALAVVVKTQKIGLKVYTMLPEDFSLGIPFLVNPDDKVSFKMLSEQLLEVGNIFFENIPEQFIQDLNSNLRKQNIIEQAFNFLLPLIKDKSNQVVIPNRKKLMHKIQNIEKEFTLKSFTGDKPNILNVVLKIDNESQKKTRGYNTFSNKKIIKFYQSLAKHFNNNFLINILYYKNRAIAYEIGFIIGTTYFGNQLAFSDKYKQYEPGKVLLFKLIENLVSMGVEILDFGSGDSSVKRSLTKDFIILYQIIITKNIIIEKYFIVIYSLKNYFYNLLFQSNLLYSTYRTFARIFTYEH